MTDKLCEVVFNKSRDVGEMVEGGVQGARRFQEVDWRLDVVLSNNSLAKVLQPEVSSFVEVL